MADVGKACRHCGKFCGDPGPTCDELRNAAWGSRPVAAKAQRYTCDELWPAVDRLLSDAYSAGMNGEEFDMLAARAALIAAAAKPSGGE